jgi:hypothetical protein
MSQEWSATSPFLLAPLIKMKDFETVQIHQEKDLLLGFLFPIAGVINPDKISLGKGSRLSENSRPTL